MNATHFFTPWTKKQHIMINISSISDHIYTFLHFMDKCINLYILFIIAPLNYIINKTLRKYTAEWIILDFTQVLTSIR